MRKHIERYRNFSRCLNTLISQSSIVTIPSFASVIPEENILLNTTDLTLNNNQQKKKNKRGRVKDD